MSRLLLFFLLFISVYSGAFSQSSYFMTFHHELDEQCFDVIEDSYHSILGVGLRSALVYEENTYQGMIWKISESGDTLSKSFKFGDTSIYFNYIEQRDDSYFIIGTSFIPPNYETKTRLEIIQLDLDLNIIEKHTIIDNSTRIGIDNKFRKLGNEYYLLGSEETDSCDYDLVIKLSEDFSLLNSYRIWEHSCKFMDCILSPDSSQVWLFTNAYNEEPGPELIVFDSVMNLVEVKDFPFKFWPGTIDIETCYEGNLTAKWFTDSTFLVGCNHTQTYDQYDIVEEDIGFSILDSSLNLVPVHYFGSVDTSDYSGFMTNLDFLTTENIFFCGNKNVIALFYPPFPSWIIAGKLNNQLEPQYVNYYGGDAYYFTHSIKYTSDGGSVIIAKRFDHLTQDNEWDVTFLKLNDQGLITNTKYSQYHQTDLAWISPNPANSVINIETTYSEGIIKIRNLQGNLVIEMSFKDQTFNVDVRSLNPGIYLCEITDKSGKKIINKFCKI